MRQPRFRHFVNDEPVERVLKAHREHADAAHLGGAHQQESVYFVERGVPTETWLCIFDCRWCESVDKRLRREEDKLHRAIMATAAGSRGESPSR